MVMGRPQEYDRKAIADALIQWAKRDDSVNFNKFCCTHDPIIPPPYLNRWANEDEDFCAAYDAAKAFLGARREEHLGSELLHVKAYDLNATVYDFFLKDEKRQQAQFESSLRQKEIAQASDQDKAKADAIIDQLNAAQKAFLSDK